MQAALFQKLITQLIPALAALDRAKIEVKAVAASKARFSR